MVRSQTLLISLTLIGIFSAGTYGATAHTSVPVSAEIADLPGSASADSNPAMPSVAAIPGATADTTARLTRADEHLNAGRQFYFRGDLGSARREFDLAVDVLLTSPDSAADHDRIERRLDELCDLIYRFDIEKLGAGETAEAGAFDKAPIDEISHFTFAPDPRLAPKLRSEITQTNSGIPLDLSDPVLGYVHYFSTDRGRSILLAGFRRAGRYKPLIQRIFAEEGVPQELIYLAQAESGFLPRAVSIKRAVGMWQFIPDTGLNYNLTRTASVDDRFDPEKATRAAAQLLKDLHNRYGDWYLAMAAYNCGAGAVDRAIERTGYADYWELLRRRALPRETANYVPIIVAMTIIAKNPKDYGLDDIQVDPPMEYDSIQISAPTNLNLVADATMLPVSEIRDLNPSLLTSVAPAGFQVHVPKGSADTSLSALESIPAENRQAWRLHHVQTGDTLEEIARSFHLTPDRIVAVNAGAASLEAGDVLVIPAVYHPDVQPASHRLTHGRTRSASSAFHSHSGAFVQRSSRIAGSRRVPAQVLHHKAAVRSASLR